MYNYAIIVNHKKDTPPKRKAVAPGESDFKQTVFQRSFNNCQFVEGQRVKIRRGHRRGTIRTIYDAIDRVKWDNNRPMYIVVVFDDDPLLEILCSPQQLKRSNQ